MGAGIDHLKVFFLGGDESPQGFFWGQGLITSRFFLPGMDQQKNSFQTSLLSKEGWLMEFLLNCTPQNFFIVIDPPKKKGSIFFSWENQKNQKKSNLIKFDQNHVFDQN